MFSLPLLLLFLLVQAIFISAHGKMTLEEFMFREAHIANAKRALSQCAHKLEKRDAMMIRNSKRDSLITDHIGEREISGIFPRATQVSSSACVMAPETVEGPYYLSGELIRKDIRESQAGLDLLLDIQIINVNTCEPIAGVYVDFWSANSTGSYSGYASEGTLGQTWLRGLQASDSNGLVQITTKFPGWYQGRAQHIHVKAHVNGTVLSNGTFSGGQVVHTGQMFFDQSLLSTVNTLPPYSSDSSQITLNVNDNILQSANSTSYDAFLSISQISSNITDGLIGSINIALDPDAVATTVEQGGSGSGGGPPGQSASASATRTAGTSTAGSSSRASSMSSSGASTNAAVSSGATQTAAAVRLVPWKLW